MVTNVIGFMDGVSLSSECTDERIEQNLFYCGYDCDTMINNVMVSGPDGKYFFAQSTILGVGQMANLLLNSLIL